MIRRLRSSLALTLALAAASACSEHLTVEQQVIVTIREMEQMVEAGERRPFMEFLSPDFTAQDGAMNREQVRALFVYQLNRHKRLRAQLFPVSVVETGENGATANFRALVTGGAGWVPESGQLFEFDTTWERVDGDWLLKSANWNPVRLEDAL